MSSEGVREVLKEVAPVATRGKEINTVFSQSGCNQIRLTDYENVLFAMYEEESRNGATRRVRAKPSRTLIQFVLSTFHRPLQLSPNPSQNLSPLEHRHPKSVG
jgi:hypothetical protein